MGKGRGSGACETCAEACTESCRAGDGRDVRMSGNDTKFRSLTLCAMLRNLGFILNATGETEEC